MPLRRRIPKRGFHNPSRFEYAVVNVESLNAFTAGETVTPRTVDCQRPDSRSARRYQGSG